MFDRGCQIRSTNCEEPKSPFTPFTFLPSYLQHHLLEQLLILHIAAVLHHDVPSSAVSNGRLWPSVKWHCLEVLPLLLLLQYNRDALWRCHTGQPGQAGTDMSENTAVFKFLFSPFHTFQSVKILFTTILLVQNLFANHFERRQLKCVHIFTPFNNVFQRVL